MYIFLLFCLLELVSFCRCWPC